MYFKAWQVQMKDLATIKLDWQYRISPHFNHIKFMLKSSFNTYDCLNQIMILSSNISKITADLISLPTEQAGGFYIYAQQQFSHCLLDFYNIHKARQLKYGNFSFFYSDDFKDELIKISKKLTGVNLLNKETIIFPYKNNDLSIGDKMLPLKL